MNVPSTRGPTIRPSRLGYVIVALLAVVAVAGIVVAVLGFSALSRRVDSFQRVRVPGQGTVTFSQAGGYLVYFEGPGFSGLSRTGTVQLSLQDSSGQDVPLTALHGAHETYTIGGHSGLAVASFTIVTPGSYVLNAGIPTDPAPTDIAVGPGLAGSIVGGVVGLIVAIFAVIAAVIVGIMTGVRRGRARRLLMAGPGLIQPVAMPGMPYGGQAPQGYVAAAPQQPYTPQQPYPPHPGVSQYPAPGQYPPAPGPDNPQHRY